MTTPRCGPCDAARAEVAHTHRVGLHPDGLLQQANERLTNEVKRLEAEVAQARAELQAALLNEAHPTAAQEGR